MSVLKKEPLKCDIQYSGAGKALQLTVIKLSSELLKSYDSVSMPSAINIRKHKKWSQLFQHQSVQYNICTIDRNVPPQSSGQKLCASYSSEISVPSCKYAWCHIPEEQVKVVFHQ